MRPGSATGSCAAARCSCTPAGTPTGATPSYAVEHPFLTEDAAAYLRDCGVRLVGIDSMNIDDTRGGERPVHSMLLGADILIVEHLCNLAALPDEGFTFSAIPPKLRGVGTFPVRAMARLR